MKIVNDGLPEVIYKFLCTDFYDGAGDSISATTLLKPNREIILCKRHADKIQIKASDRIWSLFGSGVHAALDKMYSKEDKVEQEERLRVEVNGQGVSGKFDLIKDNTLYDFKVTSAFTLMYGSRLEEWKEQLSIYRWLYYKVKGKTLNPTGKIVAILRDWAARDIGKKNYPIAPIVEVELELDDFKTVQMHVESKLKLINEDEKLEDNKLPACTDTERWVNAKTGKYNKCEKYCQAYPFCNVANANVK